jgi:simple sugar transport system permease protein
MIDTAFLLDFFTASIRTSTPLAIAALAVLLAERAGIMHIGVEGSMLLGAFTAVYFAALTGDAWIGVFMGAAVGILAGTVLALLTVTLPTDQIVAGIAFNITMVGLTSFLFRITAEITRTITPPLPPAPEWLYALPVIGPLSTISPLSWLAVGLAVGMWFFLYRSGPGLLYRAVGESSQAATAAGINVLRVRFVALMLAGILSGLAGAALTVGWVRAFSDNITLGRGFIALAAVYFGRWNPAFAAAACLLFGAGEAFALRAQVEGGNPHYYLMLPYLLTVLVVAITGRARAPQDVGIPYVRQ